jgi:hypothetical protein
MQANRHDEDESAFANGFVLNCLGAARGKEILEAFKDFEERQALPSTSAAKFS